MDFSRQETTFHVHRLRCEYLLPAGHPAPERVKARLDAALLKALPERLASLAARSLPQEDTSVWLIRRLDFAVDLNAAWEGDQLERAWAGRMLRSLSQAISGGADGEDVLRFPDRAAFLAQFLADLAAGRAWGRWYYAVFDGLRVLPLSAALRTALLDHPPTGRQALLRLPADGLGSVLRSLNRQDARRVLSGLADGPRGDAPAALWDAWAGWGSLGPGGLPPGEEAAALALFLAACRARAAAPGPELAEAALALARLGRLLADAPAGQVRRLALALARGDLAEIYRAAGADGEALRPLHGEPAGWLAEVCGRLSGELPERSAETPEPRRATPFGAAFLLLPILAELPWEEAGAGLPPAGDLSAAVALRFTTLVRCLGRPRSAQAFEDGLLRDLCRVPPGFRAADLRRWLRRLPPAALDPLLDAGRGWQAREPGPAELALACLPRRGGRAAVLLEPGSGTWRLAAGARAGEREALRERLLSRLAGEEPGLLRADAPALALLGGGPPGWEVRPLAGSENAGLPARLAADLEFLSTPAALRGPRAVDLALSALAQCVLRGFARRLPGFAASSLAYLHANFLSLPASLEDEDHRRVARLGRPPLDLILNITGMNRRAFHLDWLDERPFVLFPED